MSSERIRKLLAQLRHELDAGEVDPQTLDLARQLDADIHRLLEAQHDEGPVSALMQRAEEVEVKFAVNHRVAERILREIIDALARMGV